MPSQIKALADAISRLHGVQWTKTRCDSDNDAIFMFYGPMSGAESAARDCREQFEKVADLAALHVFWGCYASTKGVSPGPFYRGYVNGISENVNKMLKMNAHSSHDSPAISSEKNGSSEGSESE